MAKHFKPRSKKTGMFPYEAEIFKGRPKKKGVKYEYEATKLSYTVTRNYIPDFTITFPSGRVLFVEVKGWFRPADKTKRRAVKTANPLLDIRFVFPKTSQQNTKWCERNGFPFAIGSIPDEWLDDTVKEDHEDQVN